jgi:hypothetical protein
VIYTPTFTHREKYAFKTLNMLLSHLKILKMDVSKLSIVPYEFRFYTMPSKWFFLSFNGYHGSQNVEAYKTQEKW